jgi:alpha-beta hydrolase superfamily lysophospholipase
MTGSVWSDLFGAEAREQQVLVDGDQRVLLRSAEGWWSPQEGLSLAVLSRQPQAPGLAPVAIAVHGYRGFRGNWECSHRSFLNYLVQRGFHVLCPELRGAGASRRRGAPLPERVADWVADLGSLVGAAVRVSGRPVVLVGHSMGGLVSALVAVQEPTHVSCLVTLATPFQVGKGSFWTRFGARLWLSATDRPSWRQRLTTPAVDDLLQRGRVLLDHPLVPVRARSTWPGHLEEEAQREFDERARLEPVAPLLLRDLSRIAVDQPLREFDLRRALDTVSCPVLCMTGNRDEVVAPAAARSFFDVLGTRTKEWRLVGDDEQSVGHVDLVLGRRAPSLVWPVVADWLQTR